MVDNKAGARRLIARLDNMAATEEHPGTAELWAEAAAAIASLQGADTVTEAMIEAAAIEAHHASCANVPSPRPDYERACYPWEGVPENGKAAWRAIATAVLRSAAPTAQDDNGVRIEAGDDDALTETARAILADEHPDGMGLFKDRIHMSIAVAERAVVRALRTASRLSADHTGASPDVPRHE